MKGTALMILTLEFLPLLLGPLFGWSQFHFGSDFGIVRLAIDGAESRDGKVTVGFLVCFL